jgi:hypothetical protein
MTRGSGFDRFIVTDGWGVVLAGIVIMVAVLTS